MLALKRISCNDSKAQKMDHGHCIGGFTLA